MNKKIFITLSIIIVIFSGFASFRIEKSASFHEIIESFEVNYNDDYIYGIDVTDDNFCIYKLNIITGEQKFFYVDRVVDGESVVVKSVVMNNSGDLYAMLSIGGINHIELCNFEENILQSVFDFKNIDMQPITEYRNTDKNMICVFTDGESLYHYEIENGEFSLAKKTEISNIEEDYLNLIYFENNQVWAVSIEGNYSNVSEDGSLTPIFINDGSEISKNNGDIIKYSDGLAIKNIDNGHYYKLEFEDGKAKIFDFDRQFSGEKYDEIELVGALYISDINSLLTTKILDDGMLIPVVVGDKNIIIDSLKENVVQQDVIKLAVIICLISFGILGLITYYLNSKKGVSIIFIIFTISVIAGLLVIYALKTSLTDKLIVIDDERLIESGAMLNDVLIDSMSLENLEIASGKEFIEKSDIDTYHNEQEQQNNYFLNGITGEIEEINNIYSTNIYFYKNDTIYSAQGNILNTDLKYIISAKLYDAIMLAKETESDTISYYTENYLELVTVISLIYSDDGEIIGAVEVVQDYTNQYLALDMLVNKIINNVSGSAAVILFVVCLMIGISVRDLEKVAKFAYNVSQGDFSKSTEIKGKNEIAQLNRTLAKKVDEIANQSQIITNLQDKYKAFVPNMLSSIDGENNDFTVGHSRDILGHSLFIRSENGLLDEFEFFNKLLAEDIEYLAKKGVYIVRLLDFELKVFFFDTTKTLEICLDLAYKSDNDIYFSLTLEEMRVGVLGNENRKAIKAISKFDKFSTDISKIAKDYQIPMIVSREAVRLIPNFYEKYQTRKLAYVYVSSIDKVEIIYEVIFANDHETSRKKWDTKHIFEDGLDHFRQGNIEVAMRRFMRVYRENPQDLIAKEYILRCKQRTENDDNNHYFLSI